MDKPRTIFSYIGNLWYGVICFFENNYKVLEIVLTTAALLVAGYLFYETHTQVKISHDALVHQMFSDSCNGVRDSIALNLTRKSNERAEENFIIENRAWVGVSQSNGSGDLEVYIKNFGRTPAESLCIGKTSIFRNTPPTIRPNVKMSQPTSLSPDEPITIRFAQTFVDGKMGTNCCYGIITYKDIYNRRDTTEFMFMCGGFGYEWQRIGINRMK